MSTELNTSSLLLTRQQRIWLKDLVRADIMDWQGTAARPIDEVGLRMASLAQSRILCMKEVLARLEAFDAIETIQQVIDSCLLPDVEMVLKGTDITVVIRRD